MADWILIPCLVRLREDFNRLAPGRDRSSDGTKGDDAHSKRVSDHNPDETGAVPVKDADKTNEVHAIDIDKDLREPGLTMEQVVQRLLSRCRSGAENRLRYIIYNRRIWEASNDWRQETYDGDNPHTEHAHFSASYETSKEASTASWELAEEEFDDMDQATFNKMLATGLKAAAKVDPIATLMARTNASANEHEPEMARDIEALKESLSEVKKTQAAILAKLNEEKA